MYPLVLSQQEISCMRQMLRVLLAAWVKDAVTDFLRIDRPSATVHDALTKKFLTLNAKYRDLDYQFFKAQDVNSTSVVINVPEAQFNTLRRVIESKMLHDMTLPEARTLAPVLIDRVPALRAAFEVAVANDARVAEPNMKQAQGRQ